MHIYISGKHIDTGEAVRAHVEKNLTHVVDKYFGKAVEAHITLSRENHLFKTSIAVHVGHGIYVRAEGEATVPYPSIDQAIHIIEKNLRRYKKRLKDHHASGAKENIQATQYVLAPEYLNREEKEETEAHLSPTIVAEAVHELPTLTVSEAVMRMDLAGDHVFVFKNSAHGHINVVHMRADGHIGWIDPGAK